MNLDDTEILLGWSEIGRFWKKEFGKIPDLNAVLFLIGMRELGQVKTSFKKDEKMDLFHIAICRLLSYEGLYELEYLDQDGWPHYRKTSHPSHYNHNIQAA